MWNEEMYTFLKLSLHNITKSFPRHALILNIF